MDLSYEEFRRLAADESLSRYEKIGFPDAYREGAEEAIFEDIVAKLPALSGRSKRFLDIGCGCSDLPRMLIDLCERQSHEAVLVDSVEMLGQLPDSPAVTKLAGRFPEEAAPEPGSFDAVLAYSILHYVFAEGNVWAFLDHAIDLLADGGRLLVGDVPNASKRRRFFSSATGAAFHRDFMGTDAPPEVAFNRVEHEAIDDAVVLGLLARARAAGCDAYVVPQRNDLPMANRREDILIAKP